MTARWGCRNQKRNLETGSYPDRDTEIPERACRLLCSQHAPQCSAFGSGTWMLPEEASEEKLAKVSLLGQELAWES